MDIGQRVREIRKDLGMSAAELARRTGVARNTIVMIEAGSRTPSLGLVEKIAHELRREPADLFKEPVPLDEAPSQPSAATGQPRSRAAAEGHLTYFGELGDLKESQVLEILRGVEAGRITVEAAARKLEELRA